MSAARGMIAGAASLSRSPNIALLIAFAVVCVPEASAQSYFEWSQDGANLVVARMSPDVYSRLNRSGLQTTLGTVSTRPAVLAGSPGANRLLLGRQLYDVKVRNGWVDYRGIKLYVVTFHKHVPHTTPVAKKRPDLSGVWRDQFFKGSPVTLFRSGANFVYSGHQGCDGKLSWDGDVLRIEWRGKYSGRAHAISVEPGRIVWSNGNVWLK